VRTALLAGATGLVGGHLLRLLLGEDTWDRVVSVGRREVDVQHDKLEQLMAQLPDLPELARVDDAFCALGTTIKQAGSQDAFRVVDHDAVVALAEAAKRAGSSSFLHVTAMGANPGSRVFYNRVKGETERDVALLAIPTTVAFRPSILDGDRAESRRGEKAGLVVMRTLAPVLGRYRPTRAQDLALAMVHRARTGQAGTAIASTRDIKRWASGR
jgi:uncharacterized protein YbjT (DUF2867 family)